MLQDLLLSSGIEFFSREVKSNDFKSVLHEVNKYDIPGKGKGEGVHTSVP
jgi:hypothetical protein